MVFKRINICNFQFLNTDVLKVGMSEKSEVSRIYSQGASSRCLFVMECNLPKHLENTIKHIFNEKFKLHTGTEYFKGNESDMVDEFMKICFNHRVQFNLSKFELHEKMKDKKLNVMNNLIKSNLISKTQI